MNEFNQLDVTLNKENITYIKNYDIKSNSYSKTGYLIKIFILPKNLDEFQYLLKLLNEKGFGYKVIGETTNIIFLDSVIYSIVISTKLITKINFYNDEVYVECGKNLPDFVRELAMRGFSGFEGLEGIPGTVGGAIFMNAGAYGYEISDNIKSVKYIDNEGHVTELSKDKLTFSRRRSFFKENPEYIIVSAVFRTQSGRADEIYSKIEKFHIARHKYQEWVYPNLGSVYSSRRSIYDSTKYDKIYKIKLKIIRLLFYKNMIAKISNRMLPSNKRLNDFFLSHYKLNNYEKLVSKKNLNTFTNRNNTTLEIVKYISELRAYLDEDTYLENELVDKVIYKVVNESDMKLTIELNKKALKKN